MAGDPRANLQNDSDMAKLCQSRQAAAALQSWEVTKTFVAHRTMFKHHFNAPWMQRISPPPPRGPTTGSTQPPGHTSPAAPAMASARTPTLRLALQNVPSIACQPGPNARPAAGCPRVTNARAPAPNCWRRCANSFAKGLCAHHAAGRGKARGHDPRCHLRNFKNRDELFIAVAEAFWGPVKAEFRPGSRLCRKDARHGRSHACRGS